MNLVIDVGNTLIKAALFDGNHIAIKKTFDDKNIDQLLYFIQEHSRIGGAIISSVKSYPQSIKRTLNDEKIHLIEFDENTPIPVKNIYKTPKTLGKDRLAAAIAGKLFYSEKNVLVVSAGTCITYDFITKENEYLGGGISPGLVMRFKSLHLLTANLPLLDISESFDKLIGKTTDDSIYSGVLNGAITEIEGICKKYKDIYRNLKVIITGGDYKYLEKRVHFSIFAVPDLVLTGLNLVLDYNID